MFRVIVEETSTHNQEEKVLDMVIKTEKLYELIGRFTVRYGVPTEIVGEDGLSEIEFYKRYEDRTWTCAVVSFARISADNQGKTTQQFKATVPVVVAPPPLRDTTPPEERLAEMLACGVIES